MASDHYARHNGATKGASAKYGGHVYAGTTWGSVTGTRANGNEWAWDVRAKDNVFYNDSNTTWKWSAFRSYFKSSKTVTDHVEASGSSGYPKKKLQRDFMKWVLNLADERSRHGEINRRKGENDDSFNGENHYQDVFFIDKGPFTATGGSMTTNQQSNWTFNRTTGFGQGIQNWSTANEGAMALGFGPLEPDNYWNWWNRS